MLIKFLLLSNLFQGFQQVFRNRLRKRNLLGEILQTLSLMLLRKKEKNHGSLRAQIKSHGCHLIQWEWQTHQPELILQQDIWEAKLFQWGMDQVQKDPAGWECQNLEHLTSMLHNLFKTLISSQERLEEQVQREYRKFWNNLLQLGKSVL